MYFIVAAIMLFSGVSSQPLVMPNNLNMNRGSFYPIMSINQNGNLRNQMSIPFSYVIPSGSSFDNRLEERVLGASFNPPLPSRNVPGEGALGASINPLQRSVVPINELALGDSTSRRSGNELALGASINYFSGYQRFANGLLRPYSPFVNARGSVPFYRRYKRNEGVLGATTLPFTFRDEAALGASILPYRNNLQMGITPVSFATEGALGDQTSFLSNMGWMRQAAPLYMNFRYPEQALGDSTSLFRQQDDALGDASSQDEQALGSWTWPFFYRGGGFGRRIHGYKRRAKY